jgi:glycosyltransferase involved in cell wall biosynthesis
VSETLPTANKILVLAPQPFFQNRGTPIAVRLLALELARLGYDVHLLVFHEGEEVAMQGVHLHRIPAIRGIKNIPPSLSLKKIVCDVFMFFKAIGLVRRHRFTLIHAVEEAAFMAMVLKMLFGTPYIYDMDSSLAQQVVEKFAFLRPLGPVLRFCEGLAVKASCGVVAVCRALEDIARTYSPTKLVVRLEDISLLEDSASANEFLRQSFSINGPIMLYVGNLERYQGIDLLLESFQLALARGCRGSLVIIGGTNESIAAYKKYAEELQVAGSTFFCGPRPVELLGHYLVQADILLSPRIQGNNTPMKLYSYLDSGKPVLATNLPTHTQVLSEEFACLVEPTKESLAAGMARLLNDPELCTRLGAEGRRVARENYSLSAFRAKLADFYRKVFAALPPSFVPQPTKNT